MWKESHNTLLMVSIMHRIVALLKLYTFFLTSCKIYPKNYNTQYSINNNFRYIINLYSDLLFFYLNLHFWSCT